VLAVVAKLTRFHGLSSACEKVSGWGSGEQAGGSPGVNERRYQPVGPRRRRSFRTRAERTWI